MKLYPYSNMRELNLDWILDEVKKATESIQESIEQIEEAREAAQEAQNAAQAAAHEAERAAEGSVRYDNVQDLEEAEKAIARGNIDAASVSGSFGLKYNDGVSVIQNGTDFNDILTAGNYRVSTAASMQTMINSPTTDSAKVVVMTRTTAASVAQIVIPNSVSNVIFYRAKRSSGWNAWSELIGDETLGHITEETLAQFFTNANNAPINSTYSIGDNVPMDNLPPGNNMVDRAGETSGYMPGTLITRAAGTDRGVQNKYQLFIGWNATVAQSFICSRCTHVSSVGALIWSKWEKLSNSYCLSATNEVVREERITSGEAPFADLNDAPINSIYQIDLDCVSMDNDPLAGHSHVIITYGFSCVSRHGMVQQLFGLDNGVNMYVRYGYVNGPNDYRWTEWKHVLTE